MLGSGRSSIFSFAIISVTLNFFAVPASADDQPLINLSESAQQSFDQGKFKKAQVVWARAVQTMESNGQKDIFLETCLKKLGQTYRRLERTVDAYQNFSRAHEMCTALGVQDLELVKEIADLDSVYRLIDPLELGEGTARALKKANVSSISLSKEGTTHKMQVDLPERFDKPLEDKTVDGLSFDKRVTFDLAQLPDGTVSMTNIKGMHIHAKEVKMWVNLLQAIIKPENEQGSYPADVTAGKMGVTKTVSAVLPHKGFEPIAGLVRQLQSMSSSVLVENIDTVAEPTPSKKLFCEITGWF